MSKLCDSVLRRSEEIMEQKKYVKKNTGQRLSEIYKKYKATDSRIS